ncbi:hypothetical protein [Sandarakinorhabdus sp.]|uniref:hypothetical protein n=1 Tax=Sandarakinorhabdus sp. TaxID=1916663 RepID=UPI00286E90F3|nr:hypothetical protein [Sandarakinorhabdus sp.]
MNFAARYREEAPVRVALAGLGLLALAVFFTFYLQQKAPGIGGVLVWILAFLALIALSIALLLLRDSRPAVRLGSDGIRDRRWSAKPISWTNIAEFDPVRCYGLSAVQLRLREPALDPPKTLLAKFLRSYGFVAGDAVLMLVPGLDCTADALCEKIMAIGTAAIEAAEEAEIWAKGSPYAAPPNG